MSACKVIIRVTTVRDVSFHNVWPLTPKIDMATWAFRWLSDMRHKFLKFSDIWDIVFFLNRQGDSSVYNKSRKSLCPE